MSKSGASSHTIRALLPPSSRMDWPNRPCTSNATLRPTAVLPVNETSGRRRSADIDAPTCEPPTIKVHIDVGSEFFFKT